MTTNPTTRRSLLAVWHWPRWVWFVIVPLMPVLYFLSAVPVVQITASVPIVPQPPFDLIDMIYAPAYFCADNCELLDLVMQWELSWLDWMLNPGCRLDFSSGPTPPAPAI